MSDVGLNLSNLTNAAIIIIIDPADLYANVVKKMLAIIAKKFELLELTTLFYPSNFLSDLSISYEKVYNLWSMNVQYSDFYFKYLERITRFIKK